VPRSKVQTANPPTRKQRRIAKNWIASYEAAHERTGRVIYLWLALLECLQNQLPIPDRTRHYFMHGALALHELTGKPPRKGQIAPAIARALLFLGKNGPGNPLDIEAERHEFYVAFDVFMKQGADWARHHKDGRGEHSWDAIFRDVAKDHRDRCSYCKAKSRTYPSWKQVERLWRRHAIAVIPSHLIDRARERHPTGPLKVDDILR
jgi:hypothetical protein